MGDRMADRAPTGDFNRLAKQTGGPVRESSLVAQAQLTAPLPAKAGEFPASEARNIYIRSIGVSGETDSHPVLATSGAGPCLIVALYNPQLRRGGIAHLDANTDPRSLSRMIDRLGGPDAPLEAHLAGGWEKTRPMVESTLAYLTAHNSITLRSADLLNEGSGLKSLALDTRTGEVATSFGTDQTTKSPWHFNLMTEHIQTAAVRGPLRMEYDFGEVYRPTATAPKSGPGL